MKRVSFTIPHGRNARCESCEFPRGVSIGRRKKIAGSIYRSLRTQFLIQGSRWVYPSSDWHELLFAVLPNPVAASQRVAKPTVSPACA